LFSKTNNKKSSSSSLNHLTTKEQQIISRQRELSQQKQQHQRPQQHQWNQPQPQQPQQQRHQQKRKQQTKLTQFEDNGGGKQSLSSSSLLKTIVSSSSSGSSSRGMLANTTTSSSSPYFKKDTKIVKSSSLQSNKTLNYNSITKQKQPTIIELMDSDDDDDDNNDTKKNTPLQQSSSSTHYRPNRRNTATIGSGGAATATVEEVLAASKARLGIPNTTASTTTKGACLKKSNNNNINNSNDTKNKNNGTQSTSTSSTSQHRRPNRRTSAAVEDISKAKLDSKNNGGLLTSLLNSKSTITRHKILQVKEYFETIQKWDFVNALNEQQQQHHQHHHRKKQKKQKKPSNDIEEQEAVVQEVPNIFSTKGHYQSIWSPLVLNETKAQLLSDAVVEMKRRIIIVPVIATVQSNNNLYTTGDETKIQNKKMTLAIRPQKSNQNQPKLDFFANDFCVLVQKDTYLTLASRGKLPEKEKEEEIYSLVGNVEYSRRTCDGLRIQVSVLQWRKMITTTRRTINEEPLYLWKLGGNVTSLREFTALCNVGTIPLVSYLLNHETQKQKNNITKKETEKGDKKEKKVTKCASTKQIFLETMMGGKKGGTNKGFVDYAIKKFNPSQLGAISAASTEYGKGGITLVKGPPGTGKTTTLVALLNALHIRQFNQYFDKVRSIATGESTTNTTKQNNSSTLSTGAKKVAIANAAKHKPRLLVCAPSNNAVDNILRKIMSDGFIDGNGMRYNPSVVRVGVGQSTAVKDVSLQSKVNELIEEAKDVTKLQQAIAGYKFELSRIHSDITKLRRRLCALNKACPWPLSKGWEIRTDSSFEETGKCYFVNHKEKMTTYECPLPPEPGEKQFHANAMPEHRTFTSQLVKLIERYNSMTLKLERYSIVERVSMNVESSGKVKNQVMDSVRQQLETHILDCTHIVMTTLGTAGCQSLQSTMKFEVVVVDEAAQSVEPGTLVALQLGSSHAILVGDPQQLPATIFSVSGRNTKYDRSLFQRLEEAGHAVHLLNTQYRMIPEISNFPRRIFYGGYLKDGPNVTHPEYGNPLRNLVCSSFPAFKSFTIFDLDSREERGVTSLSNSTEARFALHLYESLASNTQYASNQTRVSIITPYSQQMSLLKRTFSTKLGPNYERAVEVNTVDAFQGRESNIVIFSCVRATAGSAGTIGFLSDVRRMNVALTRAKFFLFVIARCGSIIVNPYWRELVNHARDANSIIPIPVMAPGGRYRNNNNNMNIFPDLRGVKPLLPISSSKKQNTNLSRKRKVPLNFDDDDEEEDGEIIT